MTAVPSDELAVILDEQLQRIALSTQIGYDDKYAGAIVLTSERAAMILERTNQARYEADKAAGKNPPVPRTVTPETVYRRIMGILGGQSEVTDLTLADALLLACDRQLGMVDLPVLPGSEEGARRMIDAYAADHAWMSEEYKARLTHKLARLALGYLNGPLLAGDEDAIKRAEYRENLQTLKRKRREDARSATA